MGKGREKATFESYYTEMYEDRWNDLKASLLQDPVTVALDGREHPYFLDQASIFAAKSLPVSPDDTVLDMCAAPGGKSLILAGQLTGEGSLTCNDRSSQRRSRLHRVLDEFTDPSIREKIRITSHDASKWGLYEQDVYDAILLDAPCSSERHVLRDPSALAQWSVNRTRHLQILQFAMLASALMAVKVGGFILYSTCSINVHENQDVIHRLEKKRKGQYRLIESRSDVGEPCFPGTIILPDRSDNLGPLYFSLIQRME